MSLISFTPVTDGSTASASGVNTPLSTIYNDYNGGITDANIASGAAIAASKISMASLANPYKFRAYANNTPLTSNVWTKAILANEDYDTGSNFDSATNNRFTAPVNGFYHFSALATVGSAGLSTGFAEAAIYKNGSAVMDGLRITGSGSSTIIPRIPISGDLQLSAGDYIELWALCSEGGRSIAAGSALTYLSGHFISAT